MKILIVEKNNQERNLLNRILSLAGHEVTLFEGQTDLAATITQAAPDAVLMDTFRSGAAGLKGEPLDAAAAAGLSGDDLKPVLFITSMAACRAMSSQLVVVEKDDRVETPISPKAMNLAVENILGLCSVMHRGCRQVQREAELMHRV